METGYEMIETEMAEALTDLDNTHEACGDLYAEGLEIDEAIRKGTAKSEDFDRFERICAQLRAMGV